ncbi:HAD family hydrolase [Flavobacterium sp. HNIBRBA15423]|uniref:HAD family hydrolase n=1 Tax=Flavobacterium sp. HNIBRBA15423 TaxID=3458683 RepID=UPI004043B93A
MNISFDLDSTLIPYSNEFETERRNLLAKFIGIEKIRKGTPKLIRKLQEEGHQIHIYTTSYRKKFQIRITFKYYGLSVNKIVNQIENRQILTQLNLNSSKSPNTFGFDIHIDDSKGVEMEGEKFNFKTIIVDPNDKNWEETIINKLKL